MNREKKRGRPLERWELIAFCLALYDAVVVNAAYFFALLLRFDMRYSAVPPAYLYAFLKFAPLYTAIVIVVFSIFRLYNSLWEFASFSELYRIMAACFITCGIHTAAVTVFFCRMPVSYYLIGAIGQLGLVAAVRFAYRFARLLAASARRHEMVEKNAMIIGAGAAGQAVLRELKISNNAQFIPCCVIDDDPNKWGRTIDGVPIVGGRDVIEEKVKKYNISQILIAIPTLSMQERGRLLTLCSETGCALKTLPALYQLANGEVTLNKLKPVEVEDLLGRDPIQINTNEVLEQLQGKTVLVTGGGGSIGSELCRQIAGHQPGHLIIFDIYENNAYAIQQELLRLHPQLHLTVLIGSVRDEKRLHSVFEKHKPQVVFHAAAHKHVPLMEDSPLEAIKNNVFGTWNTARTAGEFGAERFVLISTDKAVNPTNVMGATKRICEMIVQNCNKEYKTEFVAVRFGNVLGSNGSVVPLFKEQIAAGGPVTVTHPDIIRYFMTIPEAVSLVLQAGALAKGGEIFVLDMGKPVRILDMAEKLIRLSGYEPYVDIKIQFSGLRPGEKLYEELLMDEEGLSGTENALIHIGRPIAIQEDFFERLENLRQTLSKEDGVDVRAEIKALVPTYHPKI